MVKKQEREKKLYYEYRKYIYGIQEYYKYKNVEVLKRRI